MLQVLAVVDVPRPRDLKRARRVLSRAGHLLPVLAMLGFAAVCAAQAWMFF